MGGVTLRLLARVYEKGIAGDRVKVNYDQAFKYYELSVQGGLVYPLCNIGIAFFLSAMRVAPCYPFTSFFFHIPASLSVMLFVERLVRALHRNCFPPHNHIVDTDFCESPFSNIGIAFSI